jgi:acyl dehydratase
MSGRYLEDFVVGQTFGSRRLRINKEQIEAFASEFDPQPFHLDEAAARDTIFQGLTASGWHTAALTMRLLIESELKPAGGIVYAGFNETSSAKERHFVRWPRPVRPGDELHIESEVLEVRPPKSLANHGRIKVRITTLNQNNEAVQVQISSLAVPRRQSSGSRIGDSEPR